MMRRLICCLKNIIPNQIFRWWWWFIQLMVADTQWTIEITCLFSLFLFTLTRQIWLLSISYCFVGFCFQDLFKTERISLGNIQSRHFSKCFIRAQIVQPYITTDTACKNSHSIFSVISDLNMVKNSAKHLKYISIWLANEFKKTY